MPDLVGPLLSLIAAALWAVSPMLMASAGRKVGSFPVVLVRGLMATLLLSATIGVFELLGGAIAFPNLTQVGWLAASGVIGMGLGDLLIYESFVTLGPRRTTQVLVLAPPVTVIFACLLLGEAMTLRALGGIIVILLATLYAVVAGQRRMAARKPAEEDEVISGGESGDVEAILPEQATSNAPPAEPAAALAAAPILQYAPPLPPRTEPGHVTFFGVAFAIGGAICMGIGAVTTRCAFRGGPPLDAVGATLIRVASGAIALWLMPLFRGQALQVLGILRDRHVLNRIAAGTIIGPFVGMFCYVAAFKLISAGVVSTLVATSPLFAIPITWLRYRARIGWDVCTAALLAAAGVGLLFYAR